LTFRKRKKKNIYINTSTYHQMYYEANYWAARKQADLSLATVCSSVRPSVRGF